MASTHVVVDGSNLATEGRTTPSLDQLEEAVAAYREEHPDADIVVVVDATFEHRMDAKDRDRLKEAELRGEVVSPPAGTVGRGDAFVLKIAKRTKGIVLSNDSFQEFHGEHPWLFEEGRLIGGKPVPSVGWIFTPRNPVRGPKSRAATAEARRRAPARVPAAKLDLARPDGSKPKVGDTATPRRAAQAVDEPMRAYALAKELGLDTKGLKELAGKVRVAVPSHSSTLSAEQVAKIRAKAAEPAPVAKVRAYALAKELELDAAGLKALAKSIGIAVPSHSSSIEEPDADAIRAAAAAPAEPSSSRRRGRRGRRGGRGASSEAAAEQPAPEKGATARASSGRKAAPARAKKQAAKAEASKEPPAKKKASRGRGHDAEPKVEMARMSAPPRASAASTNEPLDLLSFVATYGVGSEVLGTVASFTSHGAMVDVEIEPGRGFHCYVRKERLGDPPPAKARDVLSRGEERRFLVIAIDRDRRVAELELI